jgi:sulfate transport system permease protein
LPLAALLWTTKKGGFDAFWQAVTAPDAVAALKLTLGASVLVALINAVFGTLIAWVLVRDSFLGKGIINSLIDLPFALPTVVAGLTLLTLYGPNSPIGLNITYTRKAVVLAHTIFRRVVLPNLLPAILSGMALAFARAVGEYGSVVMLSGNVPFSTEVASVHIYSQIQSDYVTGAAAMSVVLLAISLAVLLSITGLQRWSAKHDR